MPSHTKGAGPSHWSRVGARVLDPPIDFWKKTGCPKWTTCFCLERIREVGGGKKNQSTTRLVLYGGDVFYFVGVSLMIPIEFSGNVTWNCFLMVP